MDRLFKRGVRAEDPPTLNQIIEEYILENFPNRFTGVDYPAVLYLLDNQIVFEVTSDGIIFYEYRFATKSVKFLRLSMTEPDFFERLGSILNKRVADYLADPN